MTHEAVIACYRIRLSLILSIPRDTSSDCTLAQLGLCLALQFLCLALGLTGKLACLALGLSGGRVGLTSEFVRFALCLAGCRIGLALGLAGSLGDGLLDGLGGLLCSSSVCFPVRGEVFTMRCLEQKGKTVKKVRSCK